MKKADIISYILTNCKYCEDRTEAEAYLCEILDINRGQFFLLEELPDCTLIRTRDVVARLNTGEPIAKILGRANFYGRNFCVSEDVLTPRQDSEILVYLAKNELAQMEQNAISVAGLTANAQPLEVLDLCCGSGCLGLTLKAENKRVNLTLADISEKALKVAKTNAKNMEISTKIVLSNMLENVCGKFDLIVSNPPYIRTSEIANLEVQVRNFDPLIALDGKADGLHFYREIARDVKRALSASGVLICEFGFDQASEVKKIFDKIFLDVKIYKDNNHNDRVVVCKNIK